MCARALNNDIIGLQTIKKRWMESDGERNMTKMCIAMLRTVYISTHV